MAWPPPERPLLRGLAWLGALILMLTLLGTPPVQRTQEARVLETAREMLGQGWRDWLIPHLNAQVRLEKPPLAYWLAAVAFKIGGVNEAAGRVPFAIVGWFTLLLTWWTAKQFFGRRAGFYAAAALAGGWMFARHARLAETDILATFFVSAAIVCIAMGRRPGASSYRWMVFSGVAIGFAILAKGLPAIFAVVFLIGLAAVEMDEQILLRWLLSGAPLVAVAIGVPWFAYVGSAVGLRTIQDEAEIATRGMEHTGSVFQYLPQTMLAVAPWTAIAILAVVLAAMRWREDASRRTTLLWLAAVLVPLCFGGQRQFHYLFPAMPAFAILSGWLIDQMLDRGLPQWDFARTLFVGTVIAVLTSAIALPIVGWKMRGGVLPIDWLTMVLCAAGAAIPLVLLWRKRELAQATFAFAIAAAIGMTVLIQAWTPTLKPINPRYVAESVRAVGPGPYYFYGENVSLTLVFYVGEIMPRLKTPAELQAAIAAHPKLIVIAQTKSGRSPPTVPEGLERAAEIKTEDQLFEVYRAATPVSSLQMK